MRRTIFVLLASCSVFLASCSPASLTEPVSATQEMVTLVVYFTNIPRYAIGTEPYEDAVMRTVPTTGSLPQDVLMQLFLGPTDDEKAQGLDVFLSGATGFSELTITDGVARVYLTGECNSKGATYTIANLIGANLRQFPEIQWVKTCDQNGETEIPDGQSDSIPFCLEP
ncbi:MAG: hypothetical protein ABIF04_01990 [Chloroflexota bacterium]